MKNLHNLLIFLTTLASSSGYASAADSSEAAHLNFSGNTSLTNDYRWRGQTQTKNDAAFQGNFILNHSSGLYVSAFASNVDFSDEAHLELDPFIGYSTPLLIGTLQPTIDIGMLRYNYIGNSDLNYNEYYIKIIFTDFISQNDNLTPSISYTNKYGGKVMSQSIGDDIKNWYFNLLYTAPFAQSNFSGVTNFGYSKANKEIYGGKAKDHFFDWKIGAAYNYKPMSLSAELAAIGTNINSSGFTNTNKNGVETKAVFTLTKYF